MSISLDKISAIIPFLFASLLFTTTADAQTRIVDEKRGHELAKRVCVNCHIVDAGENAVASGRAPAFRAIANTPGQTREGLAGKIIIPHPEMPTIALTRNEIRDLVTYIMSLKGLK